MKLKEWMEGLQVAITDLVLELSVVLISVGVTLTLDLNAGVGLILGTWVI